MDLVAYFRLLARYNRVANDRIYTACAALDAAEYRKPRRGSFGSIEALLNHLMVGDRIWMARFAGGGRVTPALNTILFDDFSALRSARSADDAKIERFMDGIDTSFLARTLEYVNNQGKACVESAPIAVGHFFNHQTHHRGQVHVMLSQTQVAPPSLDMHRILNP
jgi:uncharacterized damage-inducible protein DinB